jgi:hypothetical protein
MHKGSFQLLILVHWSSRHAQYCIGYLTEIHKEMRKEQKNMEAQGRKDIGDGEGENPDNRWLRWGRVLRILISIR